MALKGTKLLRATRSKLIAEDAAKTGELPHQWMLRVMRGEEIDGEKPNLALRFEAAKAAAPFFAPKLQAIHVNVDPQEELKELDDYELRNQMIASITEMHQAGWISGKKRDELTALIGKDGPAIIDVSAGTEGVEPQDDNSQN